MWKECVHPELGTTHFCMESFLKPLRKYWFKWEEHQGTSKLYKVAKTMHKSSFQPSANQNRDPGC